MEEVFEAHTFFIGIEAKTWKHPSELLKNKANRSLLYHVFTCSPEGIPKKSDAREMIRAVDKHYLNKISNTRPDEKVAYGIWVGGT